MKDQKPFPECLATPDKPCLFQIWGKCFRKAPRDKKDKQPHPKPPCIYITTNERKQKELILMTDNELKNRCSALAAKACANCYEGKCFDPDSLFFNKRQDDPPCVVVSKEFSIPEGGIVCDYFLLSVLPEDPEVNRLVCAEICKGPGENHNPQMIFKRCNVCAKLFLPSNNRQCYCKACAKTVERKNRARRAKEYREAARQA